MELYFCDGECHSKYYKKYNHLSKSTKFIEQIAPEKTEFGKAAIAAEIKRKQEEARLKKEGNKEVANLKKIFSRFKLGFPKPEHLEHALAYAKENNI